MASKGQTARNRLISPISCVFFVPMAAAAEDSRPHSGPTLKVSGVRPAPSGRVRVLLAGFGWPGGILELASWAKQQGLADPSLYRLSWQGTPDEQFVRRLTDFDPHVVGFGVERGQYERITEYIGPVRDSCNAEIVLFGPTATSHPIEVLEGSGADYVFAGEADRPLSRFLRLAWQRNSKDRQPEIPGLAFRYGNRTYHNTLPTDGYGRTVLDVERLVCCKTLRCLRGMVRPVAEVELIAANRLDWSLLEGVSGPFDGLLLSGGRGCPGACTFCAKLRGDEVRSKCAAQLLEEIEAADAKVADGTIDVPPRDLFRHVDEPELSGRQVAWATLCDEDFFLDCTRAIEFFRVWSRSPLRQRYRLRLQTRPRSMLTPGGEVHADLLGWIDQLKPMVLLEAESFNPELLARGHKRHGAAQLETVLDALDGTGQDYTVLQVLTDFQSTPEELIETLRRLILNGYRRPRMGIASTALTMPLYDSDVRRWLEYGGRTTGEQAGHFTDYECPQPGWMDPLAAELAELAHAELQLAMHPEQRDGRLTRALEVVLERIGQQRRGWRVRCLRDQAERALDQIKQAHSRQLQRPHFLGQQKDRSLKSER